MTGIENIRHETVSNEQLDQTKNTQNQLVRKVVFVILILFSIHFWDLEGIPFLTGKIQDFLTWAISLYCMVMVLKNKNLRFKYAIFLFLFGLFANSLAAFINFRQNPYQTLMSFNFFYSILLYFAFHFLKPNAKFVENTIIVFGILYSAIFTWQYKVYPEEIFNNSAKTAVYALQFEILGHGFLMLAYLLLLNRFLTKHRITSILVALGLFYVLLKSDFRTLIAGAIVVTILMVIRHFRLNVFYFFAIILLFILFLGLSQYQGTSNIVNKMVSKTQTEMEEGDQYVRNVQLEFYYKVYPQNVTYYLMGGGKPAGSNLFNMRDETWKMNYNIVWVDIGLFGFFIVVGGIATAGLFWYTFKAIFARLQREKLYLSFYFLYLLIVSFTNEEIFDNGIFTTQAVGLYLIDLALNERSNHEFKPENF